VYAIAAFEIFFLNNTFNLVLVSAEAELIFFLAAGIVLRFGFSVRMMLVTQRCFGHCWAVLTQSPGPSCPSHRPTGEWAGGARGAGRGDSRLRPTKGVSHTTRRHAQQ